MESKNHITDSDGFVEIYNNTTSGGIILRHTLVDVNAEDYEQVYEISVDKANDGSIVKILPDLAINNPLYKIIFNGAKENKCPDLLIDDEYVEIKTPTLPLKERKVSNAIRNSHLQADSVLLRLTAKYHVNFLKKLAKGRFITHATLKTIQFKCCITNRYFYFERADFL